MTRKEAAGILNILKECLKVSSISTSEVYEMAIETAINALGMADELNYRIISMRHDFEDDYEMDDYSLGITSALDAIDIVIDRYKINE